MEPDSHHSVEVWPDGMNQSAVVCSQQEPNRPDDVQTETGRDSPLGTLIQDNEIGSKSPRQRNRFALACTQC
jgi:hypothetical protein